MSAPQQSGMNAGDLHHLGNIMKQELKLLFVSIMLNRGAVII